MNVLRKLALALVLAGALTCVAVSAAPQAQTGPGGNVFAERPQYAQSNPYQAQSQPAQLAQQYAKAEKDEEKKEIRKKLSAVLSEQFDQHLKQQQSELDDLEKQIASLRTVLKKRLG